MNGAKKLYVKSFGCQMNVYDSQRMADTLAPEGYVETASPDDADLVILNTCHIREKAAEKVYSELGRVRRMKDAAAATGRSVMVVVAGCVAQAEGEEIIRRAPAVDLVVGPQSYHRLPDLLARAARKIENMPGALDVNAACLVERMIEPHCGSGVNHSGCFSRKAPVGGWIQPTVRLADVSRKNLNARPLRQRNE